MSVKQYIFGYGSLVSATDAARTLGRTPKLVYPVELRGWIREWGVVMDNTVATPRCVRLADGSVAPGYIVVLNVRRALPHEKPTNPNGVLFEVTEEELHRIDERENCYRRVNVTKDVVNVPTGIVYVYSGLEEYLIVNHKGGPAVIPGSYHELVSRSFASLGPDMHGAYLESTYPSDVSIYDMTSE